MPLVPANITTYGIDGKALCPAVASKKCRITLTYRGNLDHLSDVTIDVLVIDLHGYDLVLGLPWFNKADPEIDYHCRRLLGLRRRCFGGDSIPAGSSTGASTEEVHTPTTSSLCMLSGRALSELCRADAVETAYLVKIENLATCRGTLCRPREYENAYSSRAPTSFPVAFEHVPLDGVY